MSQIEDSKKTRCFSLSCKHERVLQCLIPESILTSCNIYFMAANKENENVDIKNKEGMKLAINNHLTINK